LRVAGQLRLCDKSTARCISWMATGWPCTLLRQLGVHPAETALKFSGWPGVVGPCRVYKHKILPIKTHALGTNQLPCCNALFSPLCHS